MMGTVAENLREAARVIERNGWFQGDFYDVQAMVAGVPFENCPVCLVGAVNMAVTGVPNRALALHELNALGRAVQECDPDGGWRSPAEWNDAYNRTKAEVLELLERAAQLAEAEQEGNDG